MNNVKTAGLLAFLIVLVFSVVYGIGRNVSIAIVFAFGLGFFSYFFSDKIALASTRARPVTEEELPQVYGIMRRLTQATNMPMPSLHVIDSPQPNAFATGRSPRKAAVAVTTGILDTLTYDELEGVLAHELAHVRNRDILISSIAAIAASALVILGRFAMFSRMGGDRNNPLGAIGLVISLIVAPIAAMLIRMAISRTREFEADATGAEITGRPMMLASALEKISTAAERRPMKVNEATSQLFIENPMKGFRGRGMSRWFSSHPPTEERVKRLTDMAMGIS